MPNNYLKRLLSVIVLSKSFVRDTADSRSNNMVADAFLFRVLAGILPKKRKKASGRLNASQLQLYLYRRRPRRESHDWSASAHAWRQPIGTQENVGRRKHRQLLANYFESYQTRSCCVTLSNTDFGQFSNINIGSC